MYGDLEVQGQTSLDLPMWLLLTLVFDNFILGSHPMAFACLKTYDFGVQGQDLALRSYYKIV